MPKFTTPDAPGNSLLMKWIRDHLDYPHKDWCLIWPFKSLRVGYGCFYRGGKSYSVHRYMCERTKGPPPSTKHQAAHSCNRGHEGCVNPHHLSWKTNSENQKDRADGRGRRKRSKLTHEQAAKIRAEAKTEPVRLLALRYGVSVSAIRNVIWGETWAQVAPGQRSGDLTVQQVAYIRKMVGLKSRKELAEELGIGYATICRVQNGKAYTHVPNLTLSN